jgi:K+-sensing histidine kinase KdpD
VLENAGAYAPAHSRIAIRVRIVSDRLVIAVRDHGPGVPTPDIDRVFERFYRGDDSRQTHFSSGMGLAITRGLLAIQGGRITAANHPEGGAVFTLDIPVSTRAGVDEAPGAA